MAGEDSFLCSICFKSISLEDCKVDEETDVPFMRSAMVIECCIRITRLENRPGELGATYRDGGA